MPRPDTTNAAPVSVVTAAWWISPRSTVAWAWPGMAQKRFGRWNRDMQLIPIVPHQFACPTLLEHLQMKDQRGSPTPHRQDDPLPFPAHRLSGPQQRIEALVFVGVADLADSSGEVPAWLQHCRGRHGRSPGWSDCAGQTGLWWPAGSHAPLARGCAAGGRRGAGPGRASRPVLLPSGRHEAGLDTVGVSRSVDRSAPFPCTLPRVRLLHVLVQYRRWERKRKNEMGDLGSGGAVGRNYPALSHRVPGNVRAQRWGLSSRSRERDESSRPDKIDRCPVRSPMGSQ